MIYVPAVFMKKMPARPAFFWRPHGKPNQPRLSSGSPKPFYGRDGGVRPDPGYASPGGIQIGWKHLPVQNCRRSAFPASRSPGTYLHRLPNTKQPSHLSIMVPKKIVYVRESLLNYFQQRSADLRGQALEVKALQNGA